MKYRRRYWSKYADMESAARTIIEAHKQGRIPETLLNAHRSTLERVSGLPGMVSRYFEILAEEAPEIIPLLGEEESE